MEKRKSKRHAKRLKVQFGEKGTTTFPHSGLTNDVSATGLFVVTGQKPKPGTRLHLEVTLPGELPLFIEGVVTRQVLVPPELRQVVKSGFGVRYLHGSELMAELVPAMTSALKEDPFLLSFEDEAVWRAAVEKDFRRGGLFLWTKQSVAQNMIVTVTFDLIFLNRQLAFEARVVHTNPGPDGRFGVAMMFVDAPAAIASLTSTLGH
jgi:Tfp pilus assembly protein PilZ